MIMAYKPISNKAIVESSIDAINREIEESAAKKREDDVARARAFRESEEIINLGNRAQYRQNRFNSFSESVSHALLTECIYHIYRKVMRESLVEQPNITAMMRAMVGDYIKEDAADIMYKMRNKTAVLSEMYNLITETKKKIFEAAEFDKADPSTYTIGKDVKDEFFKKLEDMDTESITAAIRDRVSHAVDDFMTANREDHEKLMNALQITKDKMDEIRDQPEEVKESYQAMYKRACSKIRNRPKSVFESMVSAMCESVMKDPQLNAEFTEGANLNIPKIIDRIETMYTFIETVNSMKLCDIDQAYMESVIQSLRG